MSKKNKKSKKVNPFKAYFGAMMSSIGTASPMDAYYGGNPDIHNFQGAAQGIPDPNHVPTRELNPVNVNTELLPLNQPKPDVYSKFQKAPDTVKPLPLTNEGKKKGTGAMDTGAINVKTITGSILPAINSMITDRHKIRTAPLTPLEVYNPYPQGTGSQAIMDKGGVIPPSKGRGKYKIDNSREQINLHDMLTYTLANRGLPKDPNMSHLISGNQQLLTDAQVWSQRGDQVKLSPEQRIQSYFNRPVGDSPIDQQRAHLNSIGHGPVATWRNSPTLNLQQQSGSSPDLELAKQASGGTVNPDKPVRTKTTDLAPVTIHGFKNKKTREVYNYLQDQEPNIYASMIDMHKKHGFTPIEAIEGGSKTINGDPAGAIFNHKTGQITVNNARKNGKISMNPVELSSYIRSEMAHKIQYDKEPIKSLIRKVGQGWLADFGVDPYTDKGSLEHEAHEVIEPKLNDEVYDYWKKYEDDDDRMIKRKRESDPNSWYYKGGNKSMENGGKISKAKAKEMLKDGTANGKKLTKKQKQYFGMIAAGKADNGGKINKSYNPNLAIKDKAFQSWYLKNTLEGQRGIPYNDDMDYDYYSFFRNKGVGNIEDHFPDTFKRPSHPTFSNESIYSIPENPGGSWNGEVFTPPSQNLKKGSKNKKAFWGAIVSAVGGQAAGQGGQKLGAAMKENVKNAAQAPQEIMNFLSQITAASRYTPEGTPLSPNIAPEQMRYENGGSLRGDDISVLWGGQAKQISENPYDGGTMQFNGASHEKGGMGLDYGGKQVEVEGAETAVKDASGNLNIMGNMNVPGTGVKFKSMSKKIAEKEKEYDKVKTTGSILVNTYDPYDKWDKLKFNSGKVMMEGGDMGQQDIVKKKADLAAIQNSLLETAEEYNLNPDALSRGDIKKAKKGTFMKAEAGAKLDPGPKFKQLKALAEANLKVKYPNSKVEIKETGAERNIKEQRGLKSRGASKTSVSLHNLGGARDYMIYIDGKLVKDKSIYKEVLHPLAQHLGLHPIGDWDAGHIGAVKEGKGTNPFSTLLREHPDLKDKPLAQDTISFLSNLVKGKKADSQEIRAYNQLTGSNIASNQAIVPDYKEAEQYLPTDPGEWFNQNLVPPDQPIWEPGKPVPQVFKLPTVPLIYKDPIKPTPETVTPPDDLTTPIIPEDVQRPSNAQALGLGQILPELVAMGNNQYEPVAMQQFAPLLEQPYQVSFQDRLNANTSTFRALERQVQDSPTALSALAAQQYGANESVLADEFRFNQGEANRVYNANRNTLNQAEMTNMGLRDQQYVRQSQARSKTKAQTHEILSSIANKYNQNRLNNQNLALYENMYNYRFKDTNKDGIAAEAVNMNPNAAFNFDLLAQPNTSTSPFSRVRVEKDPATGVVKKRTEMTPSELDKAILQLKLEKEQRNKPLVTIPKLFNKSR